MNQRGPRTGLDERPVTPVEVRRTSSVKILESASISWSLMISNKTVSVQWNTPVHSGH